MYFKCPAKSRQKMLLLTEKEVISMLIDISFFAILLFSQRMTIVLELMPSLHIQHKFIDALPGLSTVVQV